MISTPRPTVETLNAYNLAPTRSFRMQKKVLNSPNRALSNDTKYNKNGVILKKLSYITKVLKF